MIDIREHGGIYGGGKKQGGFSGLLTIIKDSVGINNSVAIEPGEVGSLSYSKESEKSGNRKATEFASEWWDMPLSVSQIQDAVTNTTRFSKQGSAYIIQGKGLFRADYHNQKLKRASASLSDFGFSRNSHLFGDNDEFLYERTGNKLYYYEEGSNMYVDTKITVERGVFAIGGNLLYFGNKLHIFRKSGASYSLQTLTGTYTKVVPIGSREYLKEKEHHFVGRDANGMATFRVSEEGNVQKVAFNDLMDGIVGKEVVAFDNFDNGKIGVAIIEESDTKPHEVAFIHPGSKTITFSMVDFIKSAMRNTSIYDVNRPRINNVQKLNDKHMVINFDAAYKVGDNTTGVSYQIIVKLEVIDKKMHITMVCPVAYSAGVKQYESTNLIFNIFTQHYIQSGDPYYDVFELKHYLSKDNPSNDALGINASFLPSKQKYYDDSCTVAAEFKLGQYEETPYAPRL